MLSGCFLRGVAYGSLPLETLPITSQLLYHKGTSFRILPEGAMVDATKSMVGSYNYHLVTLSVLIAILASYAALELAARITAASGRARLAWLAGGATAMGVGIWSMHYIGMLA